MYMDMKKMMKLVKQKKLKFSTRRIGIRVVIMKKNCVNKK